LVLHAVAKVDTHTVVPPLNTDPITVGPIAVPTDAIGGMTNDSGPGVNAGKGKAGRVGNAAKVGAATAGVAAFASATGAASATAAAMPAAATARRLIQLTRRLVCIDSSLGSLGGSTARGDEGEHSAAER
jgi:hypothetical protein